MMLAIDATSIYTKTVIAMRAQPLPQLVRARQTITPHGIGIQVIRDRFGNADVYMTMPGPQHPETFALREDLQDGTERSTDEGTGVTYPDQRIYWSLTWPTIHELGLRPPSPTLPHTHPADTSADGLVINDRYYDVSYAGEAVIGESNAYHLTLRARGSKDAHPLTDLYVDERTDLILQVVASFRNEEVIAGDSGTITLDFGREGPYWVVTRGRIDGREHSLLRTASGYATFVNDAFRFAEPASSAITRQMLDWKPTHAELIADLDREARYWP